MNSFKLELITELQIPWSQDAQVRTMRLVIAIGHFNLPPMGISVGKEELTAPLMVYMSRSDGYLYGVGTNGMKLSVKSLMVQWLRRASKGHERY